MWRRFTAGDTRVCAGIPDEEQARIRDELVQPGRGDDLAGVPEGTGLGLPIARRREKGGRRRGILSAPLAHLPAKRFSSLRHPTTRRAPERTKPVR